MRLSKVTWTGIITFSLGVAASGGTIIWDATRNALPIDQPVSVVPGHVRTREFTVNLNRPYIVSIEAKKRIPFDTLNCLLGVSTDPGNVLGKTCDRPSVIKARWVLTSGGTVVAVGETEDAHGDGGWKNETIQRIIGWFHGESGRPYVLDVEFLSDGSALAITDPHLKVEVTNAYYEDVMWESLNNFWPWVALALLGLVLLVAAAVRYRWRGRSNCFALKTLASEVDHQLSDSYLFDTVRRAHCR